MTTTDNLNIVLASTGASGARLSLYFLKILLEIEEICRVYFIYSKAFEEVYAEEEGSKLDAALRRMRTERLKIFTDDKLAAPVSSGSFRHAGMVLMPASMATVGAVASGAGDGLIHRAADVCLKEGRKLVVCPRETPLSLVHLRNMVTLKEAGAVVMPFIPQYYTKPKTLADVENHFFQRILDQLDIECRISKRWK